MTYKVEVNKTKRFHYFSVFDGNGERIGWSDVEITNMPHYTFKEHCKTTEDKCAEIVLVRTAKSHRKNGIATTILNKIVEIYKNYDLFLIVSPLDMDNTIASLTSFYEKFGFKRCESGGSTPTMVRPAKL